jgi:hypothetical protein
MRGVLANRLRTAETPNFAPQGQSVSRKTGAEVPFTGLSFSFGIRHARLWPRPGLLPVEFNLMAAVVGRGEAGHQDALHGERAVWPRPVGAAIKHQS